MRPAIEMGMRNHELVPVELIDSIARLKHGGTQLCISTLLRAKLIKHERKTYDGYALKCAKPPSSQLPF